ncbi:serine/threonine-protein kinase [Halioglobus maricola]|uniref:Serine/threonine-protein kinase n=1 Tax=Halioglobus maricola TaxID=2601894 RepID=A0A5P9NJB5_9GAMM|nr:serine/threonine-protein kinase [Halioglobus maricola]QFU75963.1 serine/threonine-protein kinase [Halioglobus maricola]
MPSDAGSVLAGKYEILRALGRGGMGEVYLAQDLRLKRNVAVKYLRGDLPEGNWAEHLRREALLLAQLNHPNIVQIYDIVEEDGTLAFVMEYVEGRNLFLHLREHRVDLGERLRWLAEISAGLAASHEAGVSHCDLKAENVLISPAGTAKVNDFGIASEKTDPAEDIAALGRLAESMLADHRHSISPAMDELLESLAHRKASARPTAAQVAERFRFAWYEYYQQETPLPEQIAPAQEGSGNLQWFGVSAALLALIAATLLYMREPEKIRYVAIAPTEITQSAQSAAGQDYTARAVVQSLRETTVAAEGLALADYNAGDLDENLTPAETMTALGADTLITSKLDCTRSPCQLELVQFSGSHARRSAPHRMELPSQTALASREMAREQWAALFPDSDLPANTDMVSEQAYIEYLNQFARHENNASPNSDTVFQLAATLDNAPSFAPLYQLYIETAFELYAATASPALLDQIESRLALADRELALPERLDFERFQLALARGDLGRADTLKNQIVSRGTDPARASYLQGEVLLGSERYAEAIPYFAAATILRPSVRYLTRQSVNAYRSGDFHEAQHALIVMQDIYPHNTRALDMLARQQISIGRLDLAIATTERSLTLSDSATTRATLGIAHLLDGDYAAAREALSRAFQADRGMTLTLLQLAEAEELLGNEPKADQLYKQVIDREQAGDLLLSPQAAALAYAHRGETDTAVRLTRSSHRQIKGLRHARAAALVYTLANMHLDALNHIEEALDAGSKGHYFNLPWFDPLCAETRFLELMEQAENDSRCVALAISGAE